MENWELYFNHNLHLLWSATLLHLWNPFLTGLPKFAFQLNLSISHQTKIVFKFYFHSWNQKAPFYSYCLAMNSSLLNFRTFLDVKVLQDNPHTANAFSKNEQNGLFLHRRQFSSWAVLPESSKQGKWPALLLCKLQHGMSRFSPLLVT